MLGEARRMTDNLSPLYTVHLVQSMIKAWQLHFCGNDVYCKLVNFDKFGRFGMVNLGSSIQIDVVYPDSCSPNNLQPPIGGLENFLGNLQNVICV